MYFSKKKYFFIIESLKDINIKQIKKSPKFYIIYRNKSPENINKLKHFRKECKNKNISFFIANNIKLMKDLKAEGLYISAHNKKLDSIYLNKYTYKIIGGAHNIKEINQKKNQGCKEILLSRIFLTTYNNKKGFLGVQRFNFLQILTRRNLVPLGGINLGNLKKINMIKCNSIAVSSMVVKNQNKTVEYLK